MSTRQVALRLAEEDLAFVDDLVAKRQFDSRAAALRAAVRLLRRQVDDEELGAAYDTSRIVVDTAEGAAWSAVGLQHLVDFYSDEPDIGVGPRGEDADLAHVSAELQQHVGQIAELVAVLARRLPSARD